MNTRSCIALYLVLANIGGVFASTWATFSDADCTKSIDTIDGQNGYPDGKAFHFLFNDPGTFLVPTCSLLTVQFEGVCTDIPDSATTSSYGGFMFITLDDGCTRKSFFFSCTNLKR